MTKRATPTPDWEIVLEDAAAFRLIVQAVSAVMTRVIFKVVRRPSGEYFLCVDGKDSGFSCCVSARLLIEQVHWNSDDEEASMKFTFCVECKHVLTAVDPTGVTLKISGNADDAKVTIHTEDPDMPGHNDVSVLSTFVDGDEEFVLTPLDFEIILECDLLKLKDMIKKAKTSDAELLRIRVFVKDMGSQKSSLVTFVVEGDNQEHFQNFCHKLQYHEDGSMVVRAASDCETQIFEICDLKPVFDHAFPVDKLEGFIKNLPTRMLVMRLKSGLPMMLTHKLRGETDEQQHIRFLVAPKNEEADR
jgi:hypothetical protein